MAVETHVHVGALPLLALFAAMVALFGTLHLFALTNESRFSRAWIALGF